MTKRSSLAIASITIAAALSSAHADMTGYVYQDIYSVSAADFAGQPDFNGTVIGVGLKVDY